MSETNAIAVIEKMQASDIFKPNALDPILDRIRHEAREEAKILDISTESNRKALASLAFKIAKSKTFLDKMRKDLVSGEKNRLKAIDEEGARLWDALEELQKEIRQPLTDWENAEKARIAEHERRLAEIIEAGEHTQREWMTITVQIMKERGREIKGDPHDWQEFSTRAQAAIKETLTKIVDAIKKREAYDQEQEELARLRAEAAERAIKEREEAAAKYAKEAAERRAEEQARIAREAVELERQRIENELAEAEARAKQAEEQRIAYERKAKEDHQRAARELHEVEERAARQAEEDRLQAAAKAKRDQEAAVESERQRVYEEQRKEREEAEKREQNKAHRAKINNGAKAALIAAGIHADIAEQALVAIIKGLVPNVTIAY